MPTPTARPAHAPGARHEARPAPQAPAHRPPHTADPAPVLDTPWAWWNVIYRVSAGG